MDTYVSESQKRFPTGAIIGLMIGIILLSVFLFSRQSLRLDEAQSLWQTSRSPAGILNVIAQDVHVPLYHLMLHFWQFFFGNGVVIARIMSLLFFLACVPVMYILGALAYNRNVGLFSATLLSISPFMNWYGNEIRMYTLFTFLTLLSHYFFLRIRREPTELIWVGYAVTAVFGIFTHYFFWLLLISQGIFFVATREQFPKKTFLKLTAVAALLLVCLIPWGAYVVSLDKIQNQAPLLFPPTSINVFNTFSQFIFGFQSDHLNTILVSLWPIVVLLGILALRRGNRVASETIYFTFTFLIPITLAFLISAFWRPVYVSRYLIFTLPSLYLLLSWVLYSYPPSLSKILRGAIVAIMLLTLGIEALSATTPVKEDYAASASYLEEQATARDVIVVSAPFTVYPMEYYYNGEARVMTLPLWNRFAVGPIPPFNEEALPQEVEIVRSSHERLWLLLSYDQGYEERLRQYFDSRFERIEDREFSPGLHLYAYKLTYDK